jgi:hypothetical protein
MTTRQIQVQRFSVTSSKSFDEVVAGVDAAIGHPDIKAFSSEVATAKTYSELEEVVHRVLGPSDLMEFTRFDLGAILRKEKGTARNSLRLVARQSAHHEANGGASAGRWFLCPRNHPD